MRPATTSTQRCDEFTVRIEPEARVGRHSDYFGTEVLEFGIVKPHSKMTIDVRARVVTGDPPDPPEAGWERARDATHTQRPRASTCCRASTSPRTASSTSCSRRSAARRRSRPCRALCELIPDRFEYRPGVTTSGPPWTSSSRPAPGVCQDYVHLGLILLRRCGIAARYVSGYLWAAGEEGDDSVEVETHAWLEALLPGIDGRGEPVWVGADPTNRRLAGETHVKIGHGRALHRRPAGARASTRAPRRRIWRRRVQMTRLDPQASARA